MNNSEQRTSTSDLVIGTGGSVLRDAFVARRQAFRALHEDGCFVISNPCDVGSARYLQHLGFAALATTSTGFAFSQGLSDSDQSDETEMRITLGKTPETDPHKKIKKWKAANVAATSRHAQAHNAFVDEVRRSGVRTTL